MRHGAVLGLRELLGFHASCAGVEVILVADMPSRWNASGKAAFRDILKPSEEELFKNSGEKLNPPSVESAFAWPFGSKSSVSLFLHPHQRVEYIGLLGRSLDHALEESKCRFRHRTGLFETLWQRVLGVLFIVGMPCR